MTQGKAEYGQNINLTVCPRKGPRHRLYLEKSRCQEQPRAFPPRTTDQGGILSLFNISKETSGFFICTSQTRSALLLQPHPRSNAAFHEHCLTAGIIGGVIAALIVLIIVIYCCCCRKRKRMRIRHG
ncbi:hypothetical protein FQN60_000100 [Etheostoma spectabile]|uniref:Uncharacterized protein n=1 Tax=Etheostoma spectabile TaxID=54343 RepID=A0A5J5CBZ7_9PERO|nr:hypothetical protein FQN60_000100 [Etheostoma spectabile]